MRCGQSDQPDMQRVIQFEIGDEALRACYSITSADARQRLSDQAFSGRVRRAAHDCTFAILSAAESTASMMRLYPPHRHKLPTSPSCTSS